MMKQWIPLLLLLALLGACTRHEVDVKPTHHTIEVKPIYMTIDVNIRVQRELDKFFAPVEGDGSEAETNPS